MAIAEKALGEGPGAGGAPLVPPVYTNGIHSQCPKCGHSPVMKSGKCPKCGHMQMMKGGDPTDKEFRIDFEFKAVSEDEKTGTLVVEGYGSTWIEDRDEESVVKDAFTESLDEYMTNPVVLLDHDKHKPIGTVTKAWTDAVGLFVQAEIPKPTAGSEGWHHKAYADVKRGIRKAFSIGGKFIRDPSRKFIEKVKLYELSVIAIPANPTSLFSVVGIKEWGSKTQTTGVGRGHGAHHRGPVGAGGPRARHRHANGVRHRHRLPKGLGMHRHRRRKDFEADLGADVQAFAIEDPNDGSDLLDTEVEDEMESIGDGISELDLEEWAGKAAGGRGNPEQLRAYFTGGAGGRIDWGSPGDFAACVKIAGKFMDNPQGFCQLRHEEATGKPAGQAAGEGKRELVELGFKGGKMGDVVDGKQVIEVDAKELETMRLSLKALSDEKSERDKEKAVEAEAKRRLEAEEKAAKEEADRKAAAQKEIDERVEAHLKALRAGKSNGTKHVWTGDGSAGGGGQKEYRLSTFMLDLVRSKKGDYDAFKRLQEQDAKAAAGYQADGYDIKAYGEGTSTTGGFLVPPQYLQSAIAEYRIAQAKVRQLCTIIRGVNSNAVLIPRETGISTTGWTAENAAKPSTDATFGQISVGIYTLAGIAKVSRQLLEDSSPAVDMIVRRALGKSLGQQEDLAFINGTGAGMPTGVLGTTGILTGIVGSKLWSSIAGAIATIQSNYFGNPTAILAHPRDVNTLRTTTDSSGRPIFLPNYFQGVDPSRGGTAAFLGPNAVTDQGQQFPMAIAPDGYVFGLPVYSDANIPTNLGGGTNETRMIIAAWDEAYVFDRVGMNLDVSSEAGTSFEQNQIWFRAEERVGFTAARQPSAFYVMTGLTPGAGL